MQETQVRSLGWEDLLEKRMAPHSSTLASRIPWTEEPGGLQSMGLQNVSHDWATTNFTFILRPECHVYSTSFEGWDGRIVHFLIVLLAFTWLPGGLPVTEEIGGGLVPTPLSRGNKAGCLPCLLPTSHCQGSVLTPFQRLIVKYSANAVSYEPISQSSTWILRDTVKITVASSESSRRNCVFLVALFTGLGFRGTGMGKCTSWPFWE